MLIMDVIGWCLAGSLEFTVAGHANDFFPVNVTFVSKRPYLDIEVVEGVGGVRRNMEELEGVRMS